MPDGCRRTAPVSPVAGWLSGSRTLCLRRGTVPHRRWFLRCELASRAGHLTGGPGLPHGGVAGSYDARVREAREGLSVALWVVVGVLAVACAVGGMQVAQAHDARAREAVQH